LFSHDLQGRVDGDAVEPGAELGAVVEAVERPVGAEKGLLDGVLGALLVAGDPPGDAEQPPAVPEDQLAEGVGVPGPGLLNESGVGGFHSTP
jgi:hypothetical protein